MKLGRRLASSTNNGLPATQQRSTSSCLYEAHLVHYRSSASGHSSPTDLQVILDDLQDKDSTLAALNEKITDLIGDGDDYKEEATVALRYHKIHNTASHVHYIRDSSARPGDSAHCVLTCTSTQGTSTQASSRKSLRGALQKLQVPVEWQGFWEQFEATIHNNRELLDIEKFMYLQSYLTRPAERAIEGVHLEQVSCVVVVKVLQEKYSCRTTLVDEHINSLLVITPVDRSS